MSTIYTAAERTIYAVMQARLIDLLLKHDRSRFSQYYDQRAATANDDAALAVYRDLGVLFFLRDELFEHILPRIIRRLSFEAPRHTIIEEPPVSGRIDWERTLASTWDEYPDQPPLQLHTRQRRRDFATPENLLTVLTLLEYRADVGHLLQSEHLSASSDVLRHPLNEIVERCERELAFPQLAGLRPSAQRIREGHDGGAEALEDAVRQRLLPGSNSAYEDLLEWRARYRSLQLLDRQASQPSAVLGADPQRDNYLYQLWIFYELVDMLGERVVSLNTDRGAMRIEFTWGADAHACTYALQHDQRIPDMLPQWSSSGRLPGVRPDFYIYRLDPPRRRVADGQTLIWREPGLIWDAKYYREAESDRVPTTPLKRMLADLLLLGEPHGTLLFALLDSTSQAEQRRTGPHQRGRQQSERLVPLQPQTFAGGPKITASELRPSNASDSQQVHAILRDLLDSAHAALGTPVEPRCQGIFLDNLSASQQIALLERSGIDTANDISELLICPKAHIGPWRADLVSRTQHCLKDASVCHIIGSSQTKPLRPPRTADDLLKELDQIFKRESDLSDAEISAIAAQVEAVTRQFAELAGAYRHIEVYYNRLRDLGLDRTLDQLQKPQRESLALAVFLVEQLDSIGASDYSAPAIHISSVVEHEIKERFFACPQLEYPLDKHYKQTLGALANLYRYPKPNTARIEQFIQQHWYVDQPRRIAVEHFALEVIQPIADRRNQAAHTDTLSRQEYTELQRLIFQSSRLGDGALNLLLLGWTS